MTRGALTRIGDVLTQQIVGVARGFRFKFDVIGQVMCRVSGREQDVADQIVEQRGIVMRIAGFTVLVVIRLLPELPTRIPGGKLHGELLINLIHHRR